MIQETIAQLTGHLKFVVDSRPLREFERNLARVQTKLNQFAKTANQKIQFKPMLNANVMAQQKGAFQQLMQQAKLQRITNDNAHRSVMANMKQQHQAAMGNATLQLANARIQQQAAIAGARLTAATAAAERRAQAARLTMNQRIAAATTRQRRLDELHAIRVQRAQLGLQRAQAASRAGGGGFGGVGVNAGAIASMMPGGGFSSLISGSGAAAAGLGALAGATAGAIIGLRMLATEAQKAGDWQAHASAQMKVFDSQAVQQNMEWLFNIANDLGVSARDTQQGVMRALIGMRDGGMSTNAAKQSTYDVMAYARASGLDTATVDLVFRAMGQMLSKGQVYSEELKSQFAEHMPGAMKIAAQAWAELNNLPADEGSMKRLSKDMEDGKIAGAMVAPFIERMTSIMGSRANDGGRLDIIRQSGDAATARRENVMQQNLAGAWNANGGELKNAVQEFQGAAVPLLRELGPLLKALAPYSAAIVKSTTDMAVSLAQFLPGITAGIEGFSENPYFKRISESIDKYNQAFASFFDVVKPVLTGPVADLAKFLLGGVVEVIARQLEFIGTVISVAARAIEWIANKLGANFRPASQQRSAEKGAEQAARNMPSLVKRRWTEEEIDASASEQQRRVRRNQNAYFDQYVQQIDREAAELFVRGAMGPMSADSFNKLDPMARYEAVSAAKGRELASGVTSAPSGYLDSQKMLDTIKSVNDSTVQAIKQAGIDSAAAMREATEAMSHPQAPVTFNIHGATDPHEVAREVNRTLDERQRREEAAAGQGF